MRFSAIVSFSFQSSSTSGKRESSTSGKRECMLWFRLGHSRIIDYFARETGYRDRQTAILSAMPCLVSELIDSPLMCSAAVQASVRCSCPWHRQTGGAGLWSRVATSRKRFSSTTRRYVVGTNYHSISSINAKQGLGYVGVVVRR